jgi:protein-S-isoprenylcysteine O-methyltransferase Ste14
MSVLDVNQWMSAFVHISLTYVFITVLHLLVPARCVRGYVRDGPSFYRLNGLAVFLLVSVAFVLLLRCVHAIDVEYLVALRLKHATCACLLGVMCTLLLVLPHEKNSSSFWLDIYLGRLKNPQWFADRVDVKILLYLLGGTTLQLNLIVFYLEHVDVEQPVSNISVYVLLYSFFLVDYFSNEHVHLYTFDFIVEYVGFKLVWGCLAFYPFFYPLAMWCAVRSMPLSSLRLLSSIGLFVLGWILSRGANNQKYRFRTDPKGVFLGLVQPISINGRLLCSGWWSLARHINYLGDTFMAVGLTIAVNGSAATWLYPFYYVVLFVARERTDYQRCQEKYGPDWNEYCQRVPYRIVPLFY